VYNPRITIRGDREVGEGKTRNGQYPAIPTLIRGSSIPDKRVDHNAHFVSIKFFLV
jgi:hypothetical protein